VAYGPKGSPGEWVPPKAGPGGWVPPKGGSGGWVPPKGGSGGWVPPDEAEAEAETGGVRGGSPSETNTVPGFNPAWLAASADRERAVGVLRAGFAEGRLTQDELDERVAQAYAARTYEQLWALTADLPAGPLPYPLFPPALPRQAPGAVLAPSAAAASRWRSGAALVLTALVIFTLAALVTAVITAHSGQPVVNTPFQQVHLQPYITHDLPADGPGVPAISPQP
jgi:hypothetical protein